MDLADGQVKEQALRGGGFSDEEVEQWKGQTAQNLQDGGYSPQEIKGYFGQKDPDDSALKATVKQNISNQATQESTAGDGTKPKREPIDPSPKPVEAKDVWDAMAAAYGNSILQLAKTGQESPIQMTENHTAAMSMANFGASMVADSPIMFAGALGAGPVGAFGVPAALRATLIDNIRDGSFTGPADFARRATGIAWDGAKGAATGYATMAAGANVAAIGALGELGPVAKALTGTAGIRASELTAQTVVASGLEGHLPKAEDFVNGAVAIAGLHAMTGGAGKALSLPDKLMNIYSETGAHPSDTIEALNNDPSLKGQAISDNPNMPPEASPKEAEAAPPPTKVPPDQKVNEGYELPEDERKEVLSRIGEEPEETKESAYQKAKDGSLDFYVNTFDKTARIKQILDLVGNEKLDDKNSYVLARTFADVNAKIDSVIHEGTIDPKTNDVNGEPVGKILSDYQKETGDTKLDNLKTFMISARSLELSKRGIEQPGERANDQAIFDAGQEKYGPYAKRLVDFQNRNLRYAEGKGLLSEDQRIAIEKAGEFYIPLHKIVEADNITGRAGAANPLKKIGSSLLQIQDPIQSMFRNTEILIRAADRNDIVRQAAKDLRMADNPEDFIEKMEAPAKPIQVSNDELAKALGSQGLDMDPDDLDGFTVFRKASQNAGGEGTISYRDNGKLMVEKVDPGLADVLNSYSEMPTQMGMFTRIFRTAANTLRFSTIQNPATGFFLRHAFRNQEQAGVFSQTGLKPFQAVGEVVGKDQEMWSQFIRDGGAISSMQKIPDAYYTDTIKEQNSKMPFIDKAWNILDNTMNFSHAFIMANDNTIRFSEYKRTIDAGGSRPDAAMNARNILADFQKEGLKRGFIQSTTAFFKAHYQGQFQFMGALADPEKRMGVLARSIGYITVPSVMLGLASAGDKRLDDQPDWLKWNYWNVHIPHWRDAQDPEALSQQSAYPDEVRGKPGAYQVNDGYVFRIPKPFASGTFFGSAIQEAVTDFQKKDPEHFASFLENVGGQMLANPIPTALEPILEQATNRNFFGGSPLVRSEMERNKLPEMQYTQYTSELAKFLGKHIADVPLLRDIGPKDAKLASPAVIDNYMNAYTGGSAKYILGTIDKMMDAKNKGVGSVVDSMLASRWQDVPLVREFLVRHDMEPQSVIDFERSQDLAQQVQGSIKELARQGDFKGVADLQTKYATEGFKVPSLQMAMRNMMSTIHKVNQSDIDAVQKRQLVDGLNYQIISAAHHGNELLDNIKQSLNTKGAGGN